MKSWFELPEVQAALRALRPLPLEPSCNAQRGHLYCELPKGHTLAKHFALDHGNEVYWRDGGEITCSS